MTVDEYKNRYQKYIDFINKYKTASNASTGSEVDSNANVESKNITTLSGEIYKREAIGTNRLLMMNKLSELYGEEWAERYIDRLESHLLYKHDETNLSVYCVSITLYPFLFNGLVPLGGQSEAPKNLDSFCGSFVNLVFAVAAQFAGAVSTPEFLTYLDYFLRREFGEDYYKHSNDIVIHSIKPKTICDRIDAAFQQVVYSLNQPAAARNFQSVFWNIAYFDEPYFHGIFTDFVFPDGTTPCWESVSWLQKYFMKWFNKERTKQVLTFPVETMNLLDDGVNYVDQEWADFAAEMYAEGHSFFTYMSDNADSLSSCCRLRNEIQDNGFSYTLGAGGVSTGSKSVLTINLNRCIQHAVKSGILYPFFLEEVVDLVHKVQLAYNENLKLLQAKGMLPLFDAGYINMSRQYLTIGVNGLVEAAQFMGIDINDNPKYEAFVQEILGMIEKYNKKYRTKEVLFNCEMIPAENVGVKHAKWDKEAGFQTYRECYNSYFYIVEDKSLNIVDKFRLHGHRYIEHLTGGSALHMNLEEHLSKEQYRQLLRVAATEGCNYFTFNIPNTVCNKCHHIDKRYLHECPECHSENVDYLTRVIGYMKRISNFSQARQKEADLRYYAPVR